MNEQEPKKNAYNHLHHVAWEFNNYFDSNFFVKEFTACGNGVMISIKQIPSTLQQHVENKPSMEEQALFKAIIQFKINLSKTEQK